MRDLTGILEESPISWLLEKSNPSVCYFTLKDVLGRSEDDSEVKMVKHAIVESQIVRSILQRQNSDGSWEDSRRPYNPKYKSSYWQIMVLGTLGIDRTNENVSRACEYIFQFQLEEGGFTSETRESALGEYDWHLKRGKKLPSIEDWVAATVFEQQLSCLTGNMASALIRLGYANDKRVRKALEWLVKIQNLDGGWLCPYWKAHVKDKHGCFYGTICSLEAFSEVKKENLTCEMKQIIQKGAEFLLMHRLFKADHHGYKIINNNWLKLSFPWFYGYDILRGLNVLTKLGYTKDERLDDALEILLQKRQKDGYWILESTPAGRMQANVETKGKPSKWVTLTALRVLKRLSLTA